VAETSVLAGLNPQQREAVEAITGPVLILAGAGSGKTRVITHRIAHLALDHGVGSERILAVTFTNKAAGEMRARAEALVGGRPLQASVSTFHSFCVRLLRREARAAGLDPGFLIYDDDDQLAAVREAMRGLDLSEKLHPPRRFLSRISARKNAARTAAAETLEPTDLLDEVMRGYQSALRAASALDFDDLLLRSVALFESDARVRDTWRERFPYLLVDEYQDTNRAQYELVRHLAGPGGNLTVVGDEDQSCLPAGAELPLQSAHPRRRRGARGAQRAAQGQDAGRGQGRGRARAAAHGLRRVRGGDLGHRAHRRAARARAGGGALPHERAEPAVRGGPAALAHPVPGAGRRGLLRAARGEGRDRLPSARRQPQGRRRVPAGGERPPARDRRQDAPGDRQDGA
jgi:hypothetical protein